MGLRQRFLLIFSFVFAFALFPNAVYAESHNNLSGVAETIERLFGFIPNIITLEKLLGEDAAAMFWARFLLWVLLFAAFYYGGSFAFKAGGKTNTRIAGTVAFVFASISALLIPEKIIVGIFQSYGLLSAIIIWFVPVIAGFFLVSMIKPRPVKAVIYLGMIFVLVAIDDSITSNFASGLADTIWYAFFKLLLAVVIIAFLWNLLFAGVEGWNASVPGGGHGWDGNGHEGREHDEHPTGDTGGRRGGFRFPRWRDITRGANAELEDAARGAGGLFGRRGGGGHRPPGQTPPATPPRSHPADPPTHGIAPPGVNPAAPVIRTPKEPKKPKIPDEKVIFRDLSRYFNGIRSQDHVGACTAFAATSIFEYIFNVLPVKSYSSRFLSPLFLYYHTRKKYGRENYDEGTSPSLTVETLKGNGVCFEEFWTFEHSATGKFRLAPAKNAEMDAVSKKLGSFRELDMHDPDQWVYEIIDYNPCYACILVPNDWGSLYNKKFYTNYNPAFTGGAHAIVIVGYYSHYPHEGKGIKAFKIRNSWGVVWGENGYIWIPAEILSKIVRHGVWVFKGWKKDSYKPNKEDVEVQIEIERLRGTIKDELKILAIGKELLSLLNRDLGSEENYKKVGGMQKDIERAINLRSLQNLKRMLERGLQFLKKALHEPSPIDGIEKELKLYINSLGTTLYGKTGKTGLYSKLANIMKNLEDLDGIHKKISECIEYIERIESGLRNILNINEESAKRELNRKV